MKTPGYSVQEHTNVQISPGTPTDTKTNTTRGANANNMAIPTTMIARERIYTMILAKKDKIPLTVTTG
jgi:hypothetical protein